MTAAQLLGFPPALEKCDSVELIHIKEAEEAVEGSSDGVLNSSQSPFSAPEL